MPFGPRTRLNVKLTSGQSGRDFCLPLEIFLGPSVRDWWHAEHSALLEDLLALIARNGQILSRDNVSSGGCKKRRDASNVLESDLLSVVWEIRETCPRATILTFDSRSSGTGSALSCDMSCMPTLPVTLLVWPAPRNVDSDDEAGRITSYFSSSSANALSISTGAPHEKKEKHDDELSRALKLSLEEEEKKKKRRRGANDNQ